MPHGSLCRMGPWTELGGKAQMPGCFELTSGPSVFSIWGQKKCLAAQPVNCVGRGHSFKERREAHDWSQETDLCLVSSVLDLCFMFSECHFEKMKIDQMSKTSVPLMLHIWNHHRTYFTYLGGLICAYITLKRRTDLTEMVIFTSSKDV